MNCTIFLNFFPYFFKQFRKSSRIACEKRRQWKNDAIAMPGLPTLAYTHTHTPAHTGTGTHPHTETLVVLHRMRIALDALD